MSSINRKTSNPFRNTKSEEGIVSTSEYREERLKLSERFLDEVLLHQLSNNDSLAAQEIPQLYYNFCREHSQLTNDFDLGHVWLIAWKRNLVYECLAENNPASIPPEASDLVVVLTLLEQLGFGE